MRIIPILIVGILCMSLIPVVGAGNGGLNIIVTQEKETYAEGDSVKLMIHVFFDGEYVDADETNITINPWGDERYITAEKIATGQYRATFTIEAGDIDGNWVEIEVKANYQTFEDTEDVDLRLENLMIDLRISKTLPSHGETVEVFATVTMNGQKVDADNITFTLKKDEEREDWEAEGEELQSTKTGTGEYKTSYTVNPGDKNSHVYNFGVDVEKGDMDDFMSIEATLLYYQVYFKDTSTATRANGTVTFDIYVADMMGAIVTGAAIWFAWMTSYDWDMVDTGTETGTTDDTGKASFSLPYANADTVEINGWANGTHNQRFGGDMEVEEETDEEEEPSEWGFEAIPKNHPEDIKPETSVTLDYTLYLDGELWDGSYIHVFAHTYLDVLFNDNLTVTNSVVSFTFTTPPVPEGEFNERVEILFRANTTNGWKQDWDRIYPGTDWFIFDLNFNIEKLNIAEKTTVTMDNSALAGNHAYVLVSPWPGEKVNLDADNYMEQTENVESKWEAGSELDWNTFGYFAFNDTTGQGGFSCDMYLPAFWNEEEHLYVIVIIPPTDDEPFWHIGAMILKPGEGGSSNVEDDDDDDDDGWFFGISGFALPVMVTGVAVAAVFYSRKRR